MPSAGKPSVESILDTVIDAIIAIDERGIIQSINKAAEKLFGYSAQEIIGMNVNLLMPNPYSGEHDRYMQNYLRTGQAKIIGIGREVVAKKKDGTIFPVYLGVSEGPREGNNRFFTGVIRDITETKRAQDDLKRQNEFTSAVLNTVQSLVMVLDSKGRILNFNRACEVTTGYAFQEVEGKFFLDFFLTSEDKDMALRNFLVVDPRAFPNHFETLWLTKKGEKRLIAWSNSGLFDRKGALEHVIGTGIDITERRDLERMVLEITKKEQQRLGQELHDGLAQHLTSTAIVAKVLEKKLSKVASPAVKDAKRVVGMINQATTQTRELAQGLYALEMQSENLYLSLKKLIRDAEKTVGIHCKFKSDGTALTVEDATAMHLYRIAREAVNNAVKHGQCKNIWVYFGKRTERSAELRIENDGKSFVKKRSTQTGLGMRIMSSRAAILNASFTVEVRPKGGTVVRCVLPLSP